MKKIMLLALAAVSAMLVVPTFASAEALHVSKTGPFTVHGGESKLLRTSGNGTHGPTVTGNGEFETTTTGWIHLTFHGVTNSLGQKCTNVAGSTDKVTTAKLPFHLVTLPGKSPGILLTPAAGGGNHFASFTCGGFVPVTVSGTGLLGTITAPNCGGTQPTATVSFQSEIPGHQKHKEDITGFKPTLSSNLAGSVSPSSMDAHATITFPENRTLTCT